MGEGEYVLAMEPCNCYVGGRTDPLNKGVTALLGPGEKTSFDVTVEIAAGATQLKELEDKIELLNRK
jgi:hypothetical protein